MLEKFVGFHGFASMVTVPTSGEPIQIMVVAGDMLTLESAVTVILAGENDFQTDRCKPCIVINSDLFPSAPPLHSLRSLRLKQSPNETENK